MTFSNKEDKITERVNYNNSATISESYIKHREDLMLNLRKNDLHNYLRNKRMINIKPTLEIIPDTLDIDISIPIEDVKIIYLERLYNIHEHAADE
jgi:hypothetical protein